MNMKNVDCSRLGTMLYLEIPKGKEAMNTATFQQHIRGNESCTKILMMDTRGCVQLISNNTYFDDSWLSGVKTAKNVMAEGVDD